MGESSRKSSIPKIVAGICIGLMVLLSVAFAGVNVYVRTAYAPFYAASDAAFSIPGINEGFIPQDLDRLNDGTWLFSGYETNGDTSPVWFLRPDGTEGKLAVERVDSSAYDGHGSGITSDGLHVFLTDGEGYLVFDAAAVEQAWGQGVLRATGNVDLEFAPAFLNIEQDAMYLGNFYHPGVYETPDAHHLDTPAGEQNPAIMYVYEADATGRYGYAEQASCAYSIPARIQGMCLTDDGQLVLSQSYGLASSHLLVYDLISLDVDAVEELPDASVFMADGREVPLFYLDALSLSDDITAPPMTEGIEWYDGRVYIANESASNKYLFGKLFRGSLVYALNLSQF